MENNLKFNNFDYIDNELAILIFLSVEDFYKKFLAKIGVKSEINIKVSGLSKRILLDRNINPFTAIIELLI